MGPAEVCGCSSSPASSSSPMTQRIVAELHPAACSKRSDKACDPTASPVTKCSLMIADRTAWPREPGGAGVDLGELEIRLVIGLEFEARSSPQLNRGKRPPYKRSFDFLDDSASIANK